MNPAISDPVAYVETKFGIRLHKVGREEYAGPCPWCGGDDRFHIWLKGNYWCRPAPGHCGKAGWLDELDGQKPLTKEELLELRVSALERKQQELEQRMTVLEQMHQSQDHIHYHKLLTDQGLGFEYWQSEGMKLDTIIKYLLGYCTSCPTLPGYASYTIPVMAAGKLWNIRHRIARPSSEGGKYRPHLAGLPSMLFNYDELKREDSRRVMILEGEKKAMVVTQETGIPSVATMGMQNFKPEWVAKFDDRWHEVLVCYDPDAVGRAADVAKLFGKRGKVVTLPAKADDFFVRHHGTANDFNYFLKTARNA